MTIFVLFYFILYVFFLKTFSLANFFVGLLEAVSLWVTIIIGVMSSTSGSLHTSYRRESYWELLLLLAIWVKLFNVLFKRLKWGVFFLCLDSQPKPNTIN